MASGKELRASTGLPDGELLEDLVAAHFQCRGHFVERNLHDRRPVEVLELDFVATDYRQQGSGSQILAEVKSGGWGFPDVFKLRGWLDYLQLNKAALMVRGGQEYRELYETVAESLGIHLVCLDSQANLPEAIDQILGVREAPLLNQSHIDVWVTSYQVERALLARLATRKRKNPAIVGYEALARYFFEINDGVFFTRNVLDRAKRVYDTFMKFPNASAKLANELAGAPFDASDQIPNATFRAAFYDCEPNGLELSTFVEHRSRLTLMKAAIDYCLREPDTPDPAVVEVPFGDTRIVINRLSFLPSSFQSALRSLEGSPHAHRYVVLWQWFTWYLGGYILSDLEQTELEFLATRAGIPIEEVPSALDFYQELFPTAGGWLRTPSAPRARLLQLFPIPYRGLGVMARRALHGPDLPGIDPQTKAELEKWERTTVDLLTEQKPKAK